jgi:hypothetical protein
MLINQSTVLERERARGKIKENNNIFNNNSIIICDVFTPPIFWKFIA